MEIVKVMNLAIAFLLELVMLVIFGYWGYQHGAGPVLKYVLSGALLLLAILLWGYWAAPKSKHRLKFPIRLLFETGIFSVAAVLLFISHHQVPAISFFSLVILNKIIAYIYKQ